MGGRGKKAPAPQAKATSSGGFSFMSSPGAEARWGQSPRPGENLSVEIQRKALAMSDNQTSHAGGKTTAQLRREFDKKYPPNTLIGQIKAS